MGGNFKKIVIFGLKVLSVFHDMSAIGRFHCIFMFSLAFCEKNEVSRQTKATPIEPHVQGRSSSTTETHSNGSEKRTNVSTDNMESLCKYQRFELEAESSSKKRDFLSYKYFINYISEKVLREKILPEHPVPSNIKTSRFLMNASRKFCSQTKGAIY